MADFIAALATVFVGLFVYALIGAVLLVLGAALLAAL